MNSAITGSSAHLEYSGNRLWNMPQGNRDLSNDKFKFLNMYADLIRHKSEGVVPGSTEILHPME